MLYILHENTYTNLICTYFVVANLICRFDVYKLLEAMLTVSKHKYTNFDWHIVYYVQKEP